MSEYTPTTEEVRGVYATFGFRDNRTPEGQHQGVAAWHAEFDRWLAAHDERVRAEEQARLIGNLRWLAKSRAEYCRLPHADEDAAIRAYHESSRLMQVLHDEHTTAEAIADLLDGSNDGMGWLPSWRWDEWRAIRAVSGQEEQ